MKTRITDPQMRLRRSTIGIHEWSLLGSLVLLLVFGAAGVGGPAFAQNNYAIWGEIKISGDATDIPSGVTIILFRGGGSEMGRQSISNRGRYRFTNLAFGDYDVVVEVDGKEITRARIIIVQDTLSPFYGFRQDFEFTWKSNSVAKSPGAISATDIYPRSQANQSLFHKAEEAAGKKKYDDATRFLRSILENDKADFQVWALLGTVYLVQEKPDDAEKAYVTALTLKPTFSQALLHLGRLRSSQKRFEEAIDPLTRAIETKPESGEINILLGEAYLQTRKGSRAVPYLDAAARLGRPEAHLRLGWLYDAAGMRDKAAAEYREFLKKRPDYSDRKKLELYISAQ